MQRDDNDHTHNRRLESWPVLERHYVPDEAAMLAALRCALGLPKRPAFSQEVQA
jgi:hypothetical protein